MNLSEMKMPTLIERQQDTIQTLVESNNSIIKQNENITKLFSTVIELLLEKRKENEK